MHRTGFAPTVASSLRAALISVLSASALVAAVVSASAEAGREADAGASHPSAARGPAAQGADADGCRAEVERRLPSGAVPWGVDVRVELRLRIRCPEDATPPSALWVTEQLPRSLRPVSGRGRPHQARQDMAVGSSITWRMDAPVEAEHELTYALLPGPVDPDAPPPTARRLPEGRWSLGWATLLELEDEQGLRRRLPVPELPPLVVSEEVPLPRCALWTRRLVEPPRPTVGQPFTVRLGVGVARCPDFARRLQLGIVVQPPTHAQDRAPLARTVTAWLERVVAARGLALGAVAGTGAPGSAGGARLVGPTEQALLVDDLVRGLSVTPTTGAELAAAARAAWDALPAWEGHQTLLIVVVDGAAPLDASSADAFRELREAVRKRDAQLLTLCVRGPCDPHWGAEVTVPDGRALEPRADELLRARRGPPLSLQGVEVVDQVARHIRLDATSPQPPSGLVAGGTVRWSALMAAERAITVSYRATPTLAGRLPLGPGGWARWSHADGGASHAAWPRAELRVEEGQPPSYVAACQGLPDKHVNPSAVELGQQATVGLALALDCPPRAEQRTDLVLAVDASGSIAGPRWAAVRAAVGALRAAIAPAMRDEQVRLGLVVFNDDIVRQLPLSSAPDAAGWALDDIAPTGGTSIAGALSAVTEALTVGRPDAQPMAVLLSDGFDNAGPSALLRAAEAMRLRGELLTTICFGGACDPALAAAATSPRFHHRAPDAGALEALLADLALELRRGHPEAPHFVDVLPPELALVPGSVDPPAERIVRATEGTTITWALTRTHGAAARYAVTPLRVGELAVGHPGRGEARWRGRDGRGGSVRWPVPRLKVRAPPAGGPCELRSEARAKPPTTSVGGPVRGELHLRLRCAAASRAVDVVLLVDHSASMGALDRLVHAKAAALRFLSTVEEPELAGPEADAHVGLVAFHGEVTRVVTPTAELERVRAAVELLQPEGRTNLPAALAAAERALDGRRPSALPAVVLLTDGATTVGRPADMLRAAERLRASGVLVSTVCVGRCDVDLSRVASRPELHATVDDPRSLPGLYAALARQLVRPLPRDLQLDLLPGAAAAAASDLAPPAAVQGGVGQWRWPTVTWAGPAAAPSALISVTWTTRPLAAGRVALAGPALLQYRIGAAGVGRARIEPPRVQAEDPRASTATPTPTGTWDGHGRLYLPRSLRGAP